MKIVQIGVLVAVIALIVLFVGGYIFNWTWIGVGPYVSPPHPQGSDFQREKTLYDWFQLAIIPVALAVGVWWLNRLQQQRDQQLAEQRAQTEQEAAEKQAQSERDIALDNQHEQALQAYIDSMSELLLENNLRLSLEDAEVRKIARVRTLTVLPRLDGKRKATVLQFLQESHLIDTLRKVVDLFGADLREADLTGADLTGAILTGANLFFAILHGAVLSGATLSGADLREANLQEANLQETIMIKADLSGADLHLTILSGADLTGANLKGTTGIIIEELKKQADSLEGATMPDGTKHA